MARRPSCNVAQNRQFEKGREGWTPFDVDSGWPPDTRPTRTKQRITRAPVAAMTPPSSYLQIRGDHGQKQAVANDVERRWVRRQPNGRDRRNKAVEEAEEQTVAGPVMIPARTTNNITNNNNNRGVKLAVPPSMGGGTEVTHANTCTTMPGGAEGGGTPHPLKTITLPRKRRRP